MPFSIHTRSDAERVQAFVSETTTAQYFNFALLTVLVYHSIITMDKEVRYFWSNPRNAVSVMYFANRYIGLVAAVCSIVLHGFKESLAICEFSIWTQGVLNMVTIVLIDYILLIRVMAFYHQNIWLDICLKVLLALEAAARLSILIYEILFQEVGVSSLAEGITVCREKRAPPVAWTTLSWAISLAYGLLLLTLALYKAAEYWRLSSGFKGLHLVSVLVQDQIIYYGCVIFCCVLRIIDICLFDINPIVSDILNQAGSPTLLCVLGGQLLINLKEAGERGANGGTNYRLEDISDIRFV